MDPIYETSSLYVYRKNCDFYVHGHSAGGTNPSLVEIMHFAKPIVAFDCEYNRASMEGIGVYFGDLEQLRSVVGALNVDPANNLRDIALRRYTWKVVRDQYFELFDQL